MPRLIKHVDLEGSGWIWIDMGGSGWIWVDLGGSGWIWMDLGGSGWIGGDVGSKSRYTSQLICYISDKAIEFATRNCLDPHQTPRLRSEADTRREGDGRTDARTQ